MIPDFISAENQILASSKKYNFYAMEVIKEDMLRYKEQINYNMNRFIDDYGNKLDNPKFDMYQKFVTTHSEEYAKISRIDRLILAFKQ